MTDSRQRPSRRREDANIPRVDGGARGSGNSRSATSRGGRARENDPSLRQNHRRSDTDRTRSDPGATGQQRSQRSSRRLSRNEVAAVSVDRAYYVSDMPSPYLTQREAYEDIADTRRRHGTITAIVVIVLMLAAVGGISGYLYQTMHHTTEETKVAHYRTAEIYVGEFLATIDTASLVKPVDEQTIAPVVSGNVIEVSAQDGSFVNIGDPLYKLDNPTITEAYNKATTALAEAKATADAKALALDEVNATVTALEAAAAAAPDDRATQAALASAITKLDPAVVESNAANATLESMQETYERAKVQQEALTIVAPIAGIVNQVNPEVVVGTPVSNGTKFCIVSDVSRLCIDMEIPLTEAGRVAEGQEVRLTFPSVPDLTVTTYVESMRDSGSIRLARVSITDPDPRISVGMLANASVIVQAIPDSFIVPLDAIQIGDDGFARLNVLLDPSRGIKTEVIVNIIATNGTEAAITAANIQVGNNVILNSSLEEQEALAAAEAASADSDAEQGQGQG